MRKQFEIISAVTALGMLLGCSTYIHQVYAEERENINTVTDAEVIGADSGIKVSVQEDGETISNSIKPTLIITNTSDKEMNLEELKLKYYYTEDGEQDETFNCYYAGTVDGNYRALTSYVQGKTVKLEEPSENADSYIELTFNGGTLDAGQSATIQVSVNKSNWSNYDRSDDYSYNNAEKITGYLNDSLVWGNELNKPDEPVYKNIVTLTSEDMDVCQGEEIDIPIKISGLSEEHDLCGCILKLKYNTDLLENVTIKSGEVCINSKNTFTSLVNKNKGKISIVYCDTGDCLEDITEDGVLAIIHARVKSTATGSGYKFTIDDESEFVDKDINDITPEFNLGSINIKEDALVSPEVSPEQENFDLDKPRDIKFTMNLKGSTFLGISGLTNGVDYTVSDNVVTLRSSYLDVLDLGMNVFTFNFSSGDSIRVLVNVTRTHRPGTEVSSEDVTAAPGEEITIPIKFAYMRRVAGCYFKLQYDTDVLENVTVKQGDICKGNKCFAESIDSETGVINVLYSDIGDGSGYITEDGVFMNISATVKQNAKVGKYRLKVYDEGDIIDEMEHEFSPDFILGRIIVIPADPQ